MVDTPDQVQVHTVDCCRQCGTSLAGQAGDSFEKRQVFDIPPLKMKVTEYQAEQKTCPVYRKAGMGAADERSALGDQGGGG